MAPRSVKIFLLLTVLVLGVSVAMYVGNRSRGAVWFPGPAETSAARVISVAAFRVEGRSDRDAIQAAIDTAKPGDTVYFPGGRYLIDRPFLFGSGVNHIGDRQTRAVLAGTGAQSILIYHTPKEPLRDTSIQNLWFDNVEVKLAGDATYSAFRNVTFKECGFTNGKRDTPWSSDYLRLIYTDGVTVDGCTFLRDAQSGGRGLILERTRYSVVMDSFFGTSRELEAGTPNGFFKTAINLHGYGEDSGDRNQDTVIDGNVWRRNPLATCPVDPPSSCEDHGLYAWGVDGLLINRNYGDGWSNTSSGGSVKLRNGDDITVTSNRFLGSGILAYTYWHTNPRHLDRLNIAGNRIDLRSDTEQSVGIFYRRADEDGSSSGQFCGESGGERQISITGNYLIGGGTIDLRCANLREVCVRDNDGALVRADITPSIAPMCPAPSAPVAGSIQRGDFNGDGKADYLHLVRAASQRLWRVHLSAGDGFTLQTWSAGTSVPGESAAVAGDFTGDGRTDLTYLSACQQGGSLCWRTYRSTGSGLVEAPESPLEPMPATQGRTPAVGDFNGDGRADIAFASSCADPGLTCWAVSLSRPDGTLTTSGWGPISESGLAHLGYGIASGDLNGDGRTDLLHRGRCASGKPCLWIQVSKGDGFSAAEFGEYIEADPAESRHFGLRTGDFNKDGVTDVAYLGRCAAIPAARWRVHLGAKSGPAGVTCVTELAPPLAG